MNILFSKAKQIATRPCGCAGKGPHKADCRENPNFQAETIQQEKSTGFNPAGAVVEEKTTTTNRFNVSAESATSAGPTEVKLTDQQVLELFMASSQNDDCLLTPYEYEEGKYRYMPLYYTYSGSTKDNKTNFFNVQNPHKLADGGAVYVARSGGLGLSAKFWGNQEPPEGTIILTPIIICNISDLG